MWVFCYLAFFGAFKRLSCSWILKIGAKCPNIAPTLANIAPTWPQHGPNMAQLGPTWAQLSPSWAQLGPNLVLRPPNLEPRPPKLEPRLHPKMQHASKMPPRCSKMPPRCSLDLPTPPKTPQKPPKSTPKAPQKLSKSTPRDPPEAPPGPFQEPPRHVQNCLHRFQLQRCGTTWLQIALHFEPIWLQLDQWTTDAHVPQMQTEHRCKCNVQSAWAPDGPKMQIDQRCKWTKNAQVHTQRTKFEGGAPVTRPVGVLDISAALPLGRTWHVRLSCQVLQVLVQTGPRAQGPYHVNSQ